MSSSEVPRTFQKLDQSEVGGLWATLQACPANRTGKMYSGPPSFREMSVWQPVSTVALIVGSCCICFSLS